MNAKKQPDAAFLKRVDELMETGLNYEAAITKVYNDEVAFSPELGEKQTLEQEKFMVDLMTRKTA